MENQQPASAFYTCCKRFIKYSGVVPIYTTLP